MENLVKIGVYRILRKMGAEREEIMPDARLMHNLLFDEQDWECFLFFVETHFNIQIPKEEEQKLVTVANTIELVQASICMN